MSLFNLTFLLKKWDESGSQIQQLRKRVFMDEFELPMNFLRHKDDQERYHIVAYEDLTGVPVGTGCLHPDGHIGRIAILPRWRKTHSVGHVLVDYIMHIARAQKMQRVWLNASLQCLDYFDRHSFYPQGEFFRYCGLDLIKIESYLEVRYDYIRPRPKTSTASVTALRPDRLV